MTETLKSVKEVVNDLKLKVLGEDEEHIAVRYQLDNFYFAVNRESERFVSVILTDFDEVTDENRMQMTLACNEVNQKIQVAKFYIVKHLVLASYEFFYLDKEDLAFHINESLKVLKIAKVKFIKESNNIQTATDYE